MRLNFLSVEMVSHLQPTGVHCPGTVKTWPTLVKGSEMSGIGNIGSLSSSGSNRPNTTATGGNTTNSSTTRPESPLSQRRSSSSVGPRSGTTARGLVAMGEGLKLKTGSASTFGAGPCLAVAVTHSDGGVNRASLTHLQPEADVQAHAAQIASFMPDNFSADMSVHVASAPGDSAAERADQQYRIDATLAALSNKYDNISFEVGDNVHVHSSDSLRVNADTGSVHTSPVRANFSEAELGEIQRRMQADPSKVKYYD